MCGFCGHIYNETDKPVMLTDLKVMNSTLYHRGPDEEGYYLNKNVGLGFRRLSIIDINHGNQPMSNETNTVWVVFNGEIYNYIELKNYLISKGHVFKTNSDTETIVHLYEEYGQSLFTLLRGMFSLVVYDSNKKLLIGGRDRFGKKPFFYYKDDHQFIFASEIKALVKSERISKEMDIKAVDQYFTYGHTMQPDTIYNKIKKLQAGYCFVLDLKNFRFVSSKYWDFVFDPDYSKSEDEWCEILEDELKKSVKMRLNSDVPLGAFLSGGLDSSVIVAFMSKFSENPVKSFTIGYQVKDYNESEYARTVSDHYGTEHHELILEKKSLDIIPQIVHSFDEPFADSSAVPTYFVSKLASEHVKVIISGDGGDELFAGYTSYTKMLMLKKNNFTPASFNKMIWGNLHKVWPSNYRGKGLLFYLSLNQHHLGMKLLWNRYEREKIFRYINNGYSSETIKEDLFDNIKSRDHLSKMQEIDIRTYLVDDILTKVDRMSMSNSLEVRVPILDHVFAEITFKIPPYYKLNNGIKKYIFKKMASKYLPVEILSNRKQGFGMPLKYWFKEDLNNYFREKLLSKNSLLSDYIDSRELEKIIKANKGQRDFTGKIWSLIVFEEWLAQQRGK